MWNINPGDKDLDGVLDGADNSPNKWNPAQEGLSVGRVVTACSRARLGGLSRLGI